MARILVNHDVSSLYPNAIRIFGYISRNQKEKDAYVDLLKMRMQAKHGKLSEEFLAPLNLTNEDLKDGLKLPLNTYSGTLRAPFNPLYDNLQGFSICMTGQLLILQLIHDLQKIPTLEMVEANTDAVEFYIDEEYQEQANKVLKDWENLTGFELEGDHIVKMCARDVNNYCEIIKVGDNDYKVNYKGGCFTGIHKFKWNKEKHKFEYKFTNDLISNSLTICAEAMLKELLFDIPCEKTINECMEPTRFQMISHLGHTYDKCIIEYPNGEQLDLQRNNRIYAGKEINKAIIYKVKGEKKDKLANCPKNPIVDNDNKLSIDDINKTWYIKYTKQKISDFKGKGEVIMDEKLKTLKKDELVELATNLQEQLDNANTNNGVSVSYIDPRPKLFKKINDFRNKMRKYNFILDEMMPDNLGGGEYISLGQLSDAIQTLALDTGLDFKFEVVDLDRFDLEAFKPNGKAPQHVATVKCIITLTDIESGYETSYVEMAQGSDTIDKALSSASSMALRNWISKNFTPHTINGKEIDYGENAGKFDVVGDVSKTEKSVVKSTTFVPTEKKVELVEKVTKEEQPTPVVDTEIGDLIAELRIKKGDDTIGEKILNDLAEGKYTDLQIMKIKLKLQNELAVL